ncbi:MAG: SelB C-terminal domain-containing protein, partial [Alphaproteobacteria bacterium]|nr:SelB C-terminal domain-containing protein [Alphaproteobacteria bacterium]
AAVHGEIAALLAGGPMEGAPIVPVSSVTGEGMAELAAMLAALPESGRSDAQRFRLAIDRSFTIAGAGTVVTGTVLSGRIALGDQVTVSTLGITARVRGLHRQNAAAETAAAGDRCAINLAGPEVSTESVRRGAMVLDPVLHAPTRRIDARITLLAEEARPLGVWMPIRLHHAAAEVLGRAVPLGAPIEPGCSGLVQLVLDAPIAAAAMDRIVLRDISAARTIGGGVILDLHPPDRRRRTQERLALLAALDATEPAEALRRMAACPPFLVDLAGFGRDRALRDPATAAVEAGLVALGPAHVIAAPVRDALRARIAALLGAHHRNHPDQPGMNAGQLRRALDPPPPPASFAALIAALQATGDLVARGIWLRLPDHAPRLAEADAALWGAIAQDLDGDIRFRPPRVRDLAGTHQADERRVRVLLKTVARQGDLIEVAPDHFFLRAVVAEMAAIAATLDTGEGFNAAAFRDMLGAGDFNAGRKVAIQVLEYFDRHGLTIRRGDLRRVDPRRKAQFAA